MGLQVRFTFKRRFRCVSRGFSGFQGFQWILRTFQGVTVKRKVSDVIQDVFGDFRGFENFTGGLLGTFQRATGRFREVL